MAKHKSGELRCPATALIDCYYCINTAQMKEIILKPHHIFICVKVFILMLVPGRLQLLIISISFASAQ